MLMRKRSSMVVSSRTNINPSSSYFATSRQLSGFSAYPSADTDPAASSTSLPETKIFSPNANLFFTDTKARITWHSAESRVVGLGIVDALRNEKPDIHRKSGNLDSPMDMFGSQLKIQIPSTHLTSVSTIESTESARSPIEFGVKNKSSLLALLSRSLSCPMACSRDVRPPPMEMELSEEYTCVITHGPNTKTTQIFDNCIVENWSTDHNYVPLPEKRSLTYQSAMPATRVFVPWKDNFMYRGEKAFNNNECPHQDMLFGEGAGNA